MNLRCAGVSSVAVRREVVALDHTLERLAVNVQEPRGGLFVAARVGEDARDIAPFDFGERRPFSRLFRPALADDVACGRVVGGFGPVLFAYAFGQIVRADCVVAQGCGAHDGIFKFAYVAGPSIVFEHMRGVA